MAQHGDKKENENYTRSYYDEKWDYIKMNNGETYWRDKENHKTYLTDTSFLGVWFNDTVGAQVNKFDSFFDDMIWNEDD